MTRIENGGKSTPSREWFNEKIMTMLIRIGSTSHPVEVLTHTNGKCQLFLFLMGFTAKLTIIVHDHPTLLVINRTNRFTSAHAFSFTHLHLHHHSHLHRYLRLEFRVPSYDPLNISHPFSKKTYPWCEDFRVTAQKRGLCHLLVEKQSIISLRTLYQPCHGPNDILLGGK